MGILERFLSFWVIISMLTGVTLGMHFPSIFIELSKLNIAEINLPIACFIWVMILPMMIQVDFSSLNNITTKYKGIILTVVINWLIKPFTMTGLAWLFFCVIYKPLISPEIATEYMAGLILLGVAPCTAMVFIWSHLTQGDANFTLVQVSVNDLILVFAFAPLSTYLLDMTHIYVPWITLLYSVILYIILPFFIGAIIRYYLTVKKENIDNFCQKCKPTSILGLVFTVIMLFGLQAPKIFEKPFDIALIAIPLIIQTYAIFFLTYLLSRQLRLPFNIAAPASLIGASNFFELTVAVAISLFGLQSGAALATTVGVLVEVPIMLSLVYLSNQTQDWFLYNKKV